MFLLLNGEKYLNDDWLMQRIFISSTVQHQAIELDWPNVIEFIRCWVQQPSSLAKQLKTKSIPIDVQTGPANDYIYHLIKNLHNYRNFSQIYNCVFSYLNRLSRLKLKYFDCDSLTKSTKDWHQQLTIFQLSTDKRYKINFVGTEEILHSFSTPIVENLLTGNRFNRNECYKVATCLKTGNPYSFLFLRLLEAIVANITILFCPNIVHKTHA